MSTFSLNNINEMYMDVLKEIGNIGAGNATTSIASMLGTKMEMNVPKVQLLDASKLGEAICPEEETVVGIFLEVCEDITGSMMFLMELPSAHFLVNKLMMRDPSYNEPFDEMDLSAMKEIGNIIAASYLSALSSIIAPPFINNERDILKLYDTSITENFCEFKQMYFKSLFSISI